MSDDNKNLRVFLEKRCLGAAWIAYKGAVISMNIIWIPIITEALDYSDSAWAEAIDTLTTELDIKLQMLYPHCLVIVQVEITPKDSSPEEVLASLLETPTHFSIPQKQLVN